MINWISINGHTFNLNKATSFSVDLKSEPYQDVIGIWQVKVHFGGGIALDPVNEVTISDSILLAEVESEKHGHRIVKGIIEGDFPYFENNKIPYYEGVPIKKEEKSDVSKDIPF